MSPALIVTKYNDGVTYRLSNHAWHVPGDENNEAKNKKEFFGIIAGGKKFDFFPLESTVSSYNGRTHRR